MIAELLKELSRVPLIQIITFRSCCSCSNEEERASGRGREIKKKKGFIEARGSGDTKWGSWDNGLKVMTDINKSHIYQKENATLSHRIFEAPFKYTDGCVGAYICSPESAANVREKKKSVPTMGSVRSGEQGEGSRSIEI